MTSQLRALTDPVSCEDIDENSISIDDAIEAIGMGRFQCRILLATGLCFTADATEIMLLSFLSLTIQSEWSLNPNQSSQLIAFVFAGSMVGTLILGYLGDRCGRRSTFLMACFIISLFGVLTSFASGFRSLIVCRFMVGFGVGGLPVVFDIFAEFLPTSERGKHLLYIEFFWCAGSVMTPLLAYMTLDKSWRLFVVVCSVPCIVSGLVGAFLCPESPRWLISIGRSDKALAILREAAATNGLNPDELFHKSITLKNAHVESSLFCDLLSKKWRKVTLYLWFTWVGYAIGYYGTILSVTRVFNAESMDDASNGITPSFDYKAIAFGASAEIAGLFLVIQTVEYSIPNIGVFPWGACEMMGSCITWVSTAEILPTEIRTTGHSAANAMGRIGAFISPYLLGTNVPLKSVGIQLLIIHLLTAWCALHLPESKGCAIGDMQLKSENDTPHKRVKSESSLNYQDD